MRESGRDGASLDAGGDEAAVTGSEGGVAGPDDGAGGLEHPRPQEASLVPEREVQRRLLAFARRFLRDRTEAEDVMQEALLRARHGLSRLRSRDRAEAWLFRICRHAAIDHRRARRVRERVWQPLTEERSERLLAPPAPAPRDVGAEAARQLRTLPAHHRVLMSLHYERGLPHGAICQLTGLSTSALRVRLFRARGVLVGQPQRARASLRGPMSRPARHAEREAGVQDTQSVHARKAQGPA